MANGPLGDHLLDRVRKEFPSPIAQAARRFQAAPGDARLSEALQLVQTLIIVRHVTTVLRASGCTVPLDERAAAVRERLAQPPGTPAPGGQGGDWWQSAACREADPELFFPDERSGGHTHQVARARELCATCQVRQPCLETALHGPQAHNNRYGIFAGTTARQRSTLRGRPSMALGTRFLQDRAVAQEALALANQVSIDRTAQQLGVSKQGLRRAFDEHGLGQLTLFQGGPERSRFYHDVEAARAAWQRAAAVGINQARKELGVSDRALRTAWQRHGGCRAGQPASPAGRARQPARAGTHPAGRAAGSPPPSRRRPRRTLSIHGYRQAPASRVGACLLRTAGERLRPPTIRGTSRPSGGGWWDAATAGPGG